MKPKFYFHVIVTIDIHKSVTDTISMVKPDIVRHPLFKVVEQGVEDYENFKAHRKYVGVLDIAQLKKFIEQSEFVETAPTLGALTVLGLLPAVSFDNNEYYANLNAYISPMLSRETHEILDKEVSKKCENSVKNQIVDLHEKIMDALQNALEDFEALENILNEAELDIHQIPLFKQI